MLKNNEASIVSVNVLGYDEDLDSYFVQYEVKVKAGVNRRRKTMYSFKEGIDSGPDEKNETLVEKIRQEIGMFNRGVRTTSRR